MEVIGILLLLGLVGGVLLMPILALVRSGQTRQDLSELQLRLQNVERELCALRERPEPTQTPLPNSAKQTAPEPAFTPTVRQEHPKPSLSLESLDSVLILPQTSVTAPAATPPPLSAAPAPRPKPGSLNWEQFIGTKLIAWLGGLVLFLAAAYFIKYSFDHELVPPEIRVAFGFLLGIGLVVGGFFLKRKAFEVTSQTLCATGVVILYAVTFACRSVYHFEFFSPPLTFALMVLITGCAFLLAVRMNAAVVAVLGMLGGFLTPVLLSTGQDNPLGLFVYIALLNLGLIAVALVRPWTFLIGLAVAGTCLMELGWTIRFLTPEKIGVALLSQLGFCALFLGGAERAHRRGRSSPGWILPTACLAAVAMVYAIALIFQSGIGHRLDMLGAIVLGGDLCLLVLAWRKPTWPILQWLAAGLAHGFLALWMGLHLTPGVLLWVLAAVLLIAVLHTLAPLKIAQGHPESTGRGAAHFFPPLALGLMLLPLLKLTEVSFLLWPMVFLVDLLAMGLAVLTRSLISVLAVLALTGLVAVAWIMNAPATGLDLAMVLGVIGAMCLLFLFGGMFLLRRLASTLGDDRAEWQKAFAGFTLSGTQSSESFLSQLPALSALMPFLLLILVTVQMPLSNPSPVFALAMALVVLLLSVARGFRQPSLPLVALVCVAGLQAVWLRRSFQPSVEPLIALVWHAAFSAVIFAFPFFCGRIFRATSLPWAASALSLPVHFLFFHRVVDRSWPNEWMGLIPAVLAIPPLLACVRLARDYEPQESSRDTVLAWFGGSALFFITLIFPIQFDRQWITVSWALEGAALCWLFHRIPHPGLRGTGVVLLAVAFARLALNPAVLSYHVRGNTPILNWYLYAYGTVVISLYVGARLLAPPRDRWGPYAMPPLLNILATLLLFLLVNLEIADAFSQPGESSLAFRFGGNLARDMAYTIAWGVFALGLVSIGIRLQLKPVRIAGLTLMGITLLKLLFHDLNELSQLYRVGAAGGVAILALIVSVLYQKFVSSENATQPSPQDPPS